MPLGVEVGGFTWLLLVDIFGGGSVLVSELETGDVSVWQDMALLGGLVGDMVFAGVIVLVGEVALLGVDALVGVAALVTAFVATTLAGLGLGSTFDLLGRPGPLFTTGVVLGVDGSFFAEPLIGGACG